MKVDEPYLYRWLQIEEGLVLGGAKLCPGGFPTMGFGHKCTTFAEKLLSVWLTERQAEYILEYDMQDRIHQAGSIPIGALDVARATVIAAMVFQMGRRRVMGFRRMRKAISAGDWDQAADEMLWRDPDKTPRIRSAWHSQTPERAQRTAEIMRTGVLPPLEGRE